MENEQVYFKFARDEDDEQAWAQLFTDAGLAFWGNTPRLVPLQRCVQWFQKIRVLLGTAPLDPTFHHVQLRDGTIIPLALLL